MATTVFEKPVSTEITTLAEQIGTLITQKTYSVSTSDNSVVSGACNSAFTKYGTKNIATDIASYGTVVSVYAKSFHGDIPVPSAVVGNTLECLDYAYGGTVTAKVTFAKQIVTL